LPDLARSLGTLGMVTEQSGSPADAANIFAERFAALLPAFEKHPRAFALLMSNLVSAYLSACEKATIQPDDFLLARLAPIFARLKDGESPQ